MPPLIERTLAYEVGQAERKTIENGQARRKSIRQDEIPALPGPVVILGDPGLGKTVLTQALGGLPGMKYIRAGPFTLEAKPESLIAAGERIVVDGLDEIASAVPGGAVEAVLRQLSAMGRPPFVLSCREADWQGAADRTKIGHNYGASPVLLHLLPFERDDAHAFLAQEFPGIDADDLLDHLADRGIEALYGNPLTLRLFAEVAQADGQLPETRAQLFDRACRVMLMEENPYHESDSHALTQEQGLLLAAGAVCAAQVLCNRTGVYTASYAKTPGEFLNIADITGLPHGQAANEALKTRLFQADGESRFTPIHRVIAEFLGAKWLARCFEDGVSQNRIFALFRQGEGVPTSLRGLHAWMAHFSDGLAGRCIAADPYAVLRYGDAETLSPDRARALLAALVRLSERDPYFRSEDWGRHPASGLMRTELRDDIRAIIEPPGRHTQLAVLVLEAMAGTDLPRQIVPILNAIVFDRDRLRDERFFAWEAISASGICGEPVSVICRLLEMKDPDSAQLAFNILDSIGTNEISLETASATVLAHLGFGGTEESGWPSVYVRYVPDNLFDDLDADRLAALLDALTAHAQSTMRKDDRCSRSDFCDLVRRLTIRILETDSFIEPARIWSWIGWLDGHRGYNRELKQRLAGIFDGNRTLRAEIIEYVLLTPCAKNVWLAGHRLADTRLGLYPTAEDIAEILRTARTRAGGGPIDAQLWRGLLLHGLTQEGLPAVVRDTAIQAADNDPELLSVIEEMSDTTEPEWKIEQREQEAVWRDEREQAFRSHRDALEERQADIAAGKFQVLAESASVYLGSYTDFRSEATPADRVYEFLGKELGDRIMSGFIAVLDRDDLPTALEIAECHSRGRYWTVEAPMICGIAEMLRRDQPIDAIDRDTLAAVYMALQRTSASDTVNRAGIGSALEKVLFESEADWEAHFRMSIESQLDGNPITVDELHRLTTDTRFTDLAGRLAAEWLSRYPALRCDTQKQLLACALDNTPDESMRSLVRNSRNFVHPDYDTMLLWLSVDYAVDFENCLEALRKAGAEDPGFLWLIRDRIAPRRRERFGRFLVDQLSYVVDAFGEHWPRVGRPMGTVTSGTHNPWDATEIIEDTINAIAGQSKPEATEALQRLVANNAPTYIDLLRHALALQQQVRRDAEYTSPTIGRLHSAVGGRLPEDIEAMRDWFGDRIDDLRERMQGSDTNMWEAYWTATDEPRNEEFCRDRLIEHISVQLPPSIRLGPETRMPAGTRADIALIRNTMKLPVEIKRQYNREVWNAASDQLDGKYTVDWQAEGRGVYIVLWFGNTPKKQTPPHPSGLVRPETPEALERMLTDRLPEARRAYIDIFVIDVSRPAGDD